MSDPRETLAALQDHVIDRRRFLAFTGALAGTALYAQMRGDAARARPLPDDPFTLGVASGDPLPDAVVLWTRLAPRPFEPWRRDADHAVEVEWQVASDERFRRIVRSGRATALPELAALACTSTCAACSRAGEYCYRFTVGSVRQPGRPHPHRPGARAAGRPS